MPDSPDLSQRLLAQLRFPCGEVPEPGTIKNVAPGIFWLRMPLPFQLNHINLWLVEEKDGWTIVDTGINTQATRDLWDKIFADRLGGQHARLTRLSKRSADRFDAFAFGGLDGDVAFEFLRCGVHIADQFPKPVVGEFHTRTASGSAGLRLATGGYRQSRTASSLIV